MTDFTHHDGAPAPAIEPAPHGADAAATGHHGAEPAGPPRLITVGSDTAPTCADGVCVL
ncbi:hypothetical protein EDD27_1344 [Nonomuraea polychroma]|uniref:Uncharacterized protein n=1 Tax=Nonomuraea polychroma TaxID=46176 RepID=A0A438LZV3_9ACTN|nr:hypothetical protein [Nonomuraea polychroma]RVX39012.1 hypothetical protein EDD27_1344 [Nonomuraea polychroma]